jgi:uncharacterized membrane protein
MGLLLIILGIIFWFTISTLLGIICIVVGLILLFVPWPGAYGYSYWHGRRGPPP